MISPFLLNHRLTQINTDSNFVQERPFFEELRHEKIQSVSFVTSWFLLIEFKLKILKNYITILKFYQFFCGILLGKILAASFVISAN